jgi:flagellar motor switch protein FliN/FliY
MSDAAGDLPLSQADVDAAMAAAGMASGPTIPVADAASVEPSITAPPGEALPGDPVAAASQNDSRVDAAGNAFDETAAVKAAAIQQEAAAPQSSGRTQAPPPSARPLDLPDLLNDGPGESQSRNIDLLRDVDLHVKIELGRSRMFVEDVLRLGPGSVVELDKLAGDPVDVLVNDRLVARGEVLVLNDNFCVRINEILSTVEDIA